MFGHLDSHHGHTQYFYWISAILKKIKIFAKTLNTNACNIWEPAEVQNVAGRRWGILDACGKSTKKYRVFKKDGPQYAALKLGPSFKTPFR